MALYVCFDDSLNNPTYAPLDTTYVVEGPDEYDDNPCAQFHHLDHAPVRPINMGEASNFARLMGWELVVEDGKVSFRTGISAT